MGQPFEKWPVTSYGKSRGYKGRRERSWAWREGLKNLQWDLLLGATSSVNVDNGIEGWDWGGAAEHDKDLSGSSWLWRQSQESLLVIGDLEEGEKSWYANLKIEKENNSHLVLLYNISDLFDEVFWSCLFCLFVFTVCSDSFPFHVFWLASIPSYCRLSSNILRPLSVCIYLSARHGKTYSRQGVKWGGRIGEAVTGWTSF